MEELPENCIMKILTFAGPQESCRLAILSTIFKSASHFDGLWESFLPPDYQTLISHSSNPSKRHLVITLCHHPILIRNATMSLMLDKRTGKNIVTIGATELSIAWGNNPDYWQLRSDDPDSMFPQVAELLKVCWFEISARLDMMSSRTSTLLSPKTFYAAYFVFKMTSGAASGFANRPVEAEVRVSGSVVSHGVIFLEGEGGDGRPRKRGDGWCEVKIGEFWTPPPAEEEEEEQWLDLKLLNRTGNWKKGVIVQGIEFRPC